MSNSSAVAKLDKPEGMWGKFLFGGSWSRAIKQEVFGLDCGFFSSFVLSLRPLPEM